jgi:hypothetical protein
VILEQVLQWLRPKPPAEDHQNNKWRCDRDDQIVHEVRRELHDTRQKVELFVERMRE